MIGGDVCSSGPTISNDPKNVATNASASVRQSPPPVTKEDGMPNGAVISPPESAAGSEEEDNASRNGRRDEDFKDLQDAVEQIPVQRAPSPPPRIHAGDLALPPQHNANRDVAHSFSNDGLDLVGRRLKSHVRSATEPRPSFSKSAETSLTGSEEESGEESLKKPQMVRKKSGELVRPALRPSSHRRPSSMPGTPTFGKAVHFDSHLEHVRHFLQVDRPLAVSAGSSPVDNYDSDTEYPFPGQGTRSPPYEWEIVTANQAPDTPLRRGQPVRLDKVWLSPDQKSLMGSVIVINLAFQKSVTCRFTLDYWKTVSEVGAEYSHEVPAQGEGSTGQDRFLFTLKLSDTAHLENKTLFLCIRYNVMGQEFWDNNNGTNLQVDFRKKHLPQNGKRGLQGAASRPVGGLPRSNRRSNTPSSTRPNSMPVVFDDFGGHAKYNFDQPIHEYLGESDSTGGLKLKTKSAGNLASDDLSKSVAAPSGQAFSNRYDFGASLSAAVQAAKDSMAHEGSSPEGLYMKSYKKPTTASEDNGTDSPTTAANNSQPKPKSAAAPGTNSPNTSLTSASYEELVNKYCFVCTAYRG